MRKYTWEIVAGVIVAVIVVAVIVSRQSGSSSNTNSVSENENAVVETDESVNTSPEESVNVNGNLNENVNASPVTNTNTSVNGNTNTTSISSFSFTAALTPSQVLSTTPKHKTVLTTVPKTISVRFNAALIEKSSLSIRHEGIEYGIGALAVDSVKHTLTRALSSQAPRGLYTVNYQGCFDDGVCSSGYFQFGVEPKP